MATGGFRGGLFCFAAGFLSPVSAFFFLSFLRFHKPMTSLLFRCHDEPRKRGTVNQFQAGLPDII